MERGGVIIREEIKRNFIINENTYEVVCYIDLDKNNSLKNKIMEKFDKFYKFKNWFDKRTIIVLKSGKITLKNKKSSKSWFILQKKVDFLKTLCYNIYINRKFVGNMQNKNNFFGLLWFAKNVI